MAISWAKSELDYSALRPKQELAFAREATYLYHFQQAAASVYATVCYPFSTATDITSNLGETPSRNLSALPKTSATTYFKSGITNSLEESYIPLAGERRRKAELNTLLAVA